MHENALQRFSLSTYYAHSLADEVLRTHIESFSLPYKQFREAAIFSISHWHVPSRTEPFVAHKNMEPVKAWLRAAQQNGVEAKCYHTGNAKARKAIE